MLTYSRNFDFLTRICKSLDIGCSATANRKKICDFYLKTSVIFFTNITRRIVISAKQRTTPTAV